MKAKFASLKWKKGDCELRQGVTNNSVPRNAVAGGNGSFICTIPAELILMVETEKGQLIYRDIVHTVRRVNGWQKISEKRFKALESKLKAINEFIYDDKDFLVGLEQIVKL